VSRIAAALEFSKRTREDLYPDHRLVGRNVPPAGGGLKRRIHVASSDEREGLSEEREGMSEEREGLSEDVEAHGMTDRPSSDSPTADRTDEGDDVEAHILGDSPTADHMGDSPTAD
jgi:hypothetical protein